MWVLNRFVSRVATRLVEDITKLDGGLVTSESNQGVPFCNDGGDFKPGRVESWEMMFLQAGPLRSIWFSTANGRFISSDPPMLDGKLQAIELVSWWWFMGSTINSG